MLMRQRPLKGATAVLFAAIAGILGAMGQHERVATLLGANAVITESIRFALNPADQATYDHALATARARLDETTFAQAWAKGQAMTLEQAVAYALEGE